MVSMATENNNQEESFAALFEESLKHEDVKEGDIVRGTRDPRRQGPRRRRHRLQVRRHRSRSTSSRSADGTVGVKAGDEIDVFLESRENEDGLCVLSKEKADRLKVWDEISGACERDELIEGTISARVKGGLSVTIRGGVKAFLPGSQVDLRPVRNLDAFIGKQHQVQGHQVQQEARQHRAVAPRAPREGARRAEGADAREAEGRPDRRGHRQEPHRVRRVHRPRRHRRPAPHHRHELGPRQRTRPSCSRSATTCA